MKKVETLQGLVGSKLIWKGSDDTIDSGHIDYLLFQDPEGDLNCLALLETGEKIFVENAIETLGFVLNKGIEMAREITELEAILTSRTPQNAEPEKEQIIPEIGEGELQGENAARDEGIPEN